MQSSRWLAIFVAAGVWTPVLFGCSSSSGSGAGAGPDAACTSCAMTDTGAPPEESGAVDSGTAGGDAALPPWDGSVLAQQCPQMQDTTPCYTCEDDFCCDTEAACLNDPECEAFTRCLRNCDMGIADDAGVHDSGVPASSGGCDLYCYSAHPEGLSKLAPRIACLTQYCTTQCTGSPPNACGACINTNCAQQQAAASDTVDGYLCDSCQANCVTGDATCLNGCVAQYPSDMAANNALLACGQMYCSSAATCN